MKPQYTSSGGRRGASTLLLLGLLTATASAQGVITQSEPDDSIPTAKDVGLAAGTSGVKVAFGHSGDGLYGAAPGNETGDVDFFKVTAAAGQVIYANVNSAGIDPEFDSYLAIYSSTGAVLAENDDKGDTSRGYERTSRVTYTATTAGDYYVCVSNWIADTPSLPSDPLTPGTAPGMPGGNEGPYQLFVGLNVNVPVPQFVGGSTGYPVPAFLPVKAVGTPRYDGVLTITNISPGTSPAADYVISGYSVTGANADRFQILNLTAPVTIPPGGSRDFNIAFNSGGTPGLSSATLNLVSNDPFAQNYVLNTYGSPVVGGGTFAFKMVRSTGGNIGSMAAADELLAGTITGTTFTGTTPVINFGTGAQGKIAGDLPFPGTPPQADQFVTQTTGTFFIRTAGTYSFLGYSDDGQRLVIDGTEVYSYNDANTDHLASVDLAAGAHTLEFTHYEGAGGDSAELLISKQPGQFDAYIASTWELLEAYSADADGDGMPNAWELANGTNPDIADAGLDGDSDGLTNLQEYTAGTLPTVADTDADGYLDGVENKSGIWTSASATGTSPIVADSDGDGFKDGLENPEAASTGATQPGTNPNMKDTDSDGYADYTEISLGTDPKVAAALPVFTYQSTLLETFDTSSFHSGYDFRRLNNNTAPLGIFDSSLPGRGNVAQLTEATGSLHNSLFFDYVDLPAVPAVQLSVDFRISGINTDPADGFGIGLFRKSTYGISGPSPRIVDAKSWENPTGGGGYPDALHFGFSVYGTDAVRVTGPTNPGTALATFNPAFPLVSDVFNRAIITILPNGPASSMVKLEIIEDVDGAATRRVIFDNVLVPDFVIGSEDFRLIAGARTGGSVAKIELDNISAAVPQLPTPLLILSNDETSLLADFQDGSNAGIVPASLTATLNGTAIPVTPVKTGGTTTVKYTLPAGAFFPSGTNTVVFNYTLSSGTQTSETRTFAVNPYFLLPASLALPASSGTVPGFKVRTWQGAPVALPDGTAQTISNRIDYAEGLLAGPVDSLFAGGNLADLSGAANGYQLAEIVNFEQEAAAAGFFPGDTTVPGIPGTTGSNDNYVVEALTWVNFPEIGLYDLGVTADDGMRLSVTHAPVLPLTIVSPAASARSVPAVPSILAEGGAFGPYPNPPVTRPVVMAVPADAATPLTNAAAIAGNIALIDRGAVSFALKIKNAQDAGAVGVIIVQNTANAGALPFSMGGDATVTGITLSGVMISKQDGDTLKSLITAGGLTVTYGTDGSTTLAKADVNTTTLARAAVAVPGLYPMRLINNEGAGGANLEFYSIDADGVRHLVNDLSDPEALTSFSAISGNATVGISLSGGNVVIQYNGVLQSSTNLGPFVDVPGATSPYTVPAGSPGRLFFRARQ